VARDPYTDRTLPTTEAYADPGRLRARIALYRHRQPVLNAASTRSWQPGDGFSRVLDRIRERVAEVIAREDTFRFRTALGILVCR